MRRQMNLAQRYALCWVIACAIAHALRLVLVWMMGMWTADGRLASQGLFDLIVFIHLALIGAIFCLIAGVGAERRTE
jgi:hypothetical protein